MRLSLRLPNNRNMKKLISKSTLRKRPKRQLLPLRRRVLNKLRLYQLIRLKLLRLKRREIPRLQLRLLQRKLSSINKKRSIKLRKLMSI
jgi:hypothetical protein